MSKEVWKPIPGFPGYEVSNTGKVRSYQIMGKGKRISKSPQRILKPSNDTRGYPGVNLRSNGKTKYIRIHRLVALSFIGPCPTNMEVCHNDGNPANNHLDNLRYDTHQSNMGDCVLHGATLRGQDAPSSKLSNDQVIKIRELFCYDNVTIRELSETYGIIPYNIRRVVYGMTYKDAGGPISKRPGNKKVSKRDITRIRNLYKNGKFLAEIGDMYDMSESSISLIVNGIRWPNAGGPIKGKDY